MVMVHDYNLEVIKYNNSVLLKLMKSRQQIRHSNYVFYSIARMGSV